jgi:serine/threonine-protein kinase
VAIKVLRPALADDEVIVRRFEHEARIAANLYHPHIVTIHDVGDAGGAFYIAMRYVEGETLGQLLRREGPLDPERALRVLGPVAEALDFAHGRGILHRDVKPANILVEAGDRPTLSDFGIARAAERTHLTGTGMVIGTPEYMSPEQALGKPVDHRTDLYALGVVLYEALGGRPPLSAPSTPALLYLHVHEPPPPLYELRPELPRALGEVLAKALAKEPDARHESAAELVAAARAALDGPAPAALLGPPTAPTVPARPTPPRARPAAGPATPAAGRPRAPAR